MTNSPPAHCGISYLDKVTQHTHSTRQRESDTAKARGTAAIDAAARQAIKSATPTTIAKKRNT